jgi:ATP-dependent exoDNAse (exonuclease V) alpha subunit
MAELTQVRRQHHPWAREATQAFSTGNTATALAAYEEKGAIVAAETKVQARAQLLESWAQDARRHPTESQLILAYTRDDVHELNIAAREIRITRHELGPSEVLTTNRCEREFAPHDRILFLRNEKSLGLKNGTLGTIEAIDHGVLQVKLDGPDETQVIVDTRDYQDLDHGYATTVHKSQGSTVDRTYVLASRYFDRHTSYVALSRHREAATVFYGRDEFAAGVGQGGVIDPAAARQKLCTTLSRARPKELAHDYLDRHVAEQPTVDRSAPEPTRPPTPEEIEAAARERWLSYRAGAAKGLEPTSDLARRQQVDRSRDLDQGRELPDDDLSL